MSVQYAAQLRSHLASYKRSVLQVEANGLWSHNNESYPHILPRDQQWLNILEPIRDSLREYLEAITPSIRLHRDFHHLNSSQATAFNLFYPCFSTGHGAELLAALGGDFAKLEEWSFEHVPDREERTNLDFWLRLIGGAEVHIEVKLTESAFGEAAVDDVHRAKLADVYRPRLRGKIDASVPDRILLKHYQLMRLVSGLDTERGDQVLVIAPAANIGLTRLFDKFTTLLSNDIRPRVRLISLEQMCERLGVAVQNESNLDRTLQLFVAKYLPQLRAQ